MNNYNELIANLQDEKKVEEATTKKVNAVQTLKLLKQYYYTISHDDYYAAKAKLDANVELKKSIREEIKSLELLKDKATLTDEEEQEVLRINKLLEEKDKSPETEKILTDKINQIEEVLKELRVLIKNSFE